MARLIGIWEVRWPDAGQLQRVKEYTQQQAEKCNWLI